ncbi:MAG TPA: DNA polymerase III subunit delta [bacterium]|nr:DNA polymerase III subunit delta [bacterium]
MSGSPSAVYLLLGEEDVRADEALRTILHEAVPDEERALNLDVIDAGTMPIQDVITRCETLPFFGARRAVVLNVRNPESWRAAEQDALADYLNQGSPPSVLVIVAPRLDQRRRLSGVLQRKAHVIRCDPLDPEQLPAWLVARARESGKTMTPEGANLLVELAGGGLRALGLEVAKLAAYAGDRETITAADVREVASHVAAQVTIFEVMDAVGHRRADDAFRLLDTLIALGEPPLRILYMLEDQVRMLARVQELVDRGVRNRSDVQKALGSRAWRYRDYQKQVDAFGRIDVEALLGLLLETDGAIKTGQMPPRLALETLIVRMSGA